MVMHTGDWVFMIFISVLISVSVTCNAIVVFVVFKDKKLRNVTNIMICNLAFSDILLAGFFLPQNLHDLRHEEHYNEGVVLCKLVNACPIWCITCSIYSLVIISYERKRGIVHSLLKQIPIRYCKIIVPVLWISSTFIAIPTIVEFGEDIIENENNNDSFISCGTRSVSYEYSVANGIFLLLCSYVIPLIILWYNYTGIIRFVWKKGKEIQPAANQPSGMAASSVILKKRVQIVKMLILVAVLFAVSWVPYFISLVIAKVTGKDNSENATSFENMLKIFLAAFSTAYNFIVYVVFNSNFRHGLKQVIYCCCKEKSDMENRKIDVTTIVPSSSRSKQR